MRNLLKYVLLATVIVAMPILANAADKVGVVSSDEVLQNSEVGKKTMADLKAKVESKERDIQRQNEEIKRMGDDYQKKSAALSAEARAKAQSELETKARKMMEDQQGFAQQLDVEQKKLMEPLFKVFTQVVGDYAKKNGFSLIIDKRAALYHASGLDVTAEITKDFDAAARRSK